jgi:GH24 family phage-related lysozyme (muramidase)
MKKSESDQEIKQQMQNLIEKFEGNRVDAYDDATGKSVKNILKIVGNVTVGIGFNMDTSTAKNEWLQVFPANNPNFNDVYFGKIKLTNQQSKLLFQHSFELRYNRIANYYGHYWQKLTQNEQTAIMSVAYNNEKLVTYWKNKETNFSKNIKLWAKTKDLTFLHNAANEIRFNSGSQAKKLPALQNRRNHEAAMLLGVG